jgi:hypothetical protein
LWADSFRDVTLIILIVLAVIALAIAFAVEYGKDLSWLDGTAILATVVAVTCLRIIYLYYNLCSDWYYQYLVTRAPISEIE